MIDKDYKVSIITVVYNGAKTIEQTIQSVIGQTYKNIEYIIIDGLSVDGTQRVVEKYIDSIDCFISEKDDGLYYAMNKGIQHATGEIIGIINSDDWYAKDTVERIVSFFVHNPVDLVHGRTLIIYQDGSDRMSPIQPLEMLWHEMVVSHPSVFVKKEVYEKYGLFNTDYKVAADYELMLKFYCKHVRFGFINDVLAYFRYGGYSHRNRSQMIEEHKNVCMNYVDLCPTKNEMLEKIKGRYKSQRFSMAIRERKILSELLHAYFHEMISELIIFGAGTWGNVCYEGLKNSTIRITLFVDNNPSKWNQEVYGIKVVSPEEISDIEGYVLIAIRDKGEEIQQQLESIGNKRLKYVSLGELADILENMEETNRGC